MKLDNKAWHYLTYIVFNGKKEIPIELVAEFRKLAELHKLDYYCDFVRGNVLPDTLLKDPWEWKFLKNISKILPDGVQILVLKGRAARDMDLYPFSFLRQSADLDIFVSGVNNYKERKAFFEYLKDKNQIELSKDWERHLKKLKTVSVFYKNNLIEVHFDLFSPLGNLSNFGFGLKKWNKILEREIINKSLSYQGLENIRKMNYEDYWLYCIFHFLKDFPNSSLRLILDAFLILYEKKTTLKEIKKRAQETNQLFWFEIGKYIFSQLRDDFNETIELATIYKKIFKLEKIFYTDRFSIRNRLIDSFSKAITAARGRLFLSLTYFIPYFLIGNFILNEIDETLFSRQGFSNLINKILYCSTKIKNLLKSMCLKAAGVKKHSSTFKILDTQKKLITLTLQDLKLTFNVPVEFYPSLENIWKGFTSEDHLNERIIVEKINSNGSIKSDLELTYSNDNFFLKLPNNVSGTANINGSGKLLANKYWDIRTFALGLFYSMALKREDLLLVHSGAIKVNNECFIFPGESSTGKSTFFNLVTKINEVEGINDDTILLKKEDNAWYVYPTPFMSKTCQPIICEKSKLTRIIDIVKVCGGHEIYSLEKTKALAILLNNSQGLITFDDSGFLLSNISRKVFDISKQIKFCTKIKYSLEDTENLLSAFQNWLTLPEISYKSGSKLTRLVELRGKSMEPIFKNGDILKVEEVTAEKLKAKDIIGFRTNSYSFPIIHRVKYLIRHKSQTTVITKGDNSIYEDAPNILDSSQKILKIVGAYKVERKSLIS